MRMAEPTVAPGVAPPWWLEEALAADTAAGVAPSLVDEVEADVAVIGGGYTGLWTALALRERDSSLRVTILEKELVGWGPSGRNGGFLHGYWTHLAGLRELLGAERALDVCRAADRVIPAVRAFCEERGEDVWLREGGYLKVSAAPLQDATVERAVRAARELGVEAQCVPLTAQEVGERVRSPGFRRGAFFKDGATVQPARLARALRRAVLADGVSLYERTPVLRIRAGRPTVLEAPRGRLRAHEVVVATNAWMAGWTPVAGKLTNFGSYVVLTEPVPELLEEIGWTGGEAVTDGRMFLHYFRTTNDGRVEAASTAASPPTAPRLAEQSAACASSSRVWPRRESRIPGAGRSTSRPTTSPSSAPCRRRASTTGPATRATASARPGSAARSSPRSSPARRTSGPHFRSSAGRCRRFRPSQFGVSAEGSSGRRSSPARRRPRRGPEAPSTLARWQPFHV
jgi:glycine/D-amino acid oxidase-like deaminating enzyme